MLKVVQVIKLIYFPSSGLVLMTRCLILPDEPEDFIVDHPFIFLLTEKQKKLSRINLLFIGRIVNIK